MEAGIEGVEAFYGMKLVPDEEYNKLFKSTRRFSLTSPTGKRVFEITFLRTKDSGDNQSEYWMLGGFSWNPEKPMG